MSVACAPEAPESAESMAGEPACELEVAAPGVDEPGFPWSPCCSCPVAARIAASEVYDEPNTYIVPDLLR